jgi:sigma-B regulation protein RsbU (phosphoserine phosphatase)
MSDHIDVLPRTELFGGMSRATLELLSREMGELDFDAGQTLFTKGEAGDAVYVTNEGRLRLESEGLHLVTRGLGECVGEFSLIDEGPRSASALADTPVTVLRRDRAQFQAALLRNPEVARGVFRILTAKLRQAISIHVDYAIEKERWRQDLQRAREIQMGMAPHGDLKTEHANVSGFCQPAVEVGGDYYDFLSIDRDQIGVVIGDVTGHGFYAALMVAMAKSCLNTLTTVDNSPASIMLAMRHTLSLSIQRRLLMPCFYVCIDPWAGKLTYANAGYPPPRVYRQASKQLEELPALDPILGALDLETPIFQQKEVPWSTGDVLVT